MSLTTRCPACGTTFRVVPDQLKVSEGWVRCGRCSEVFDARVSLAPHLPVMTEVVEPPAQVEPATLVSADPLPDASSGERPEPVWDDASQACATPPEAAPDLSPASIQAAASVALPDAPTASGAEPAQGDPAPAVPPLADPPLAQTSFMRRAQRAAFWRRPGVRLALALVSLLLALGLAGQVLYQQRDLIAQRLPGLRPVLTALCQPLACRVGVPQRIEAVSIDASAFTRLSPEAFRLQLTLSNTAATAVAMPAIELTLTDTQDQPVLRRVLQPADLGTDTPAALAPAGEWSATVTLTVAPASAPAIAGYRLLAFYP
jgi:predicted Zn finger-like uncharacterized protein